MYGTVRYGYRTVPYIIIYSTDYNTVSYGTVRYGIIICCNVRYGTVPFTKKIWVWYCMVPYGTVWFRYGTVPLSSIHQTI